MGSSQASRAPAARRRSTAAPTRPSGPVARGVEGHWRGRVRKLSAGAGSHERGPRWGGRLDGLLGPADRRAPEDLQRRRSWHREGTVGGIDDARTHRQGTAAYGDRIEQLQRHAATDHVDYRIHCPDLVEGDLFGVLVVDGAFRDGQKAEGLQGARGSSLRQPRTLYRSADIPEGSVGVLVRISDVCPERADAVHLDPLRSEIEGDAEAA